MQDKNMLNNLLGSLDSKILKTKINAAVDMLKKESPEDLAKKLQKADKKQLEEQLLNLDLQKIKSSGLNIKELKNRITAEDINKLKISAGEENKDLLDKALSIYDKL